MGDAPQRNVLLIGGGGREHALALAIVKSPRLGTLYATHTGNPGIARVAQAVDVPVSIKEIYRLRQFCDKHAIDLVVIGPEGPLAEGYADELATRADGSKRLVFGPSKQAAQLEADKAFAKQLMRAASIPTAEGRVFDNADRADEYMRTRDEAQVIKAAGLAAGKGVIVPSTTEEALDAIDRIMRKRVFGDAGRRILIEERLTGREVSVLALCDGRNILTLPPCQDHKRLGDGDTGPNTGGMGVFCPAGTLDDATGELIERDVLVPIVDAMRREDTEFRGVLYAGLMLTHAGPKVLEFNVRFGDPECQTLMSLLESDAIEMLEATATGRLGEVDVRFANRASVCVVLASAGYPDAPRKGTPIEGVEEAEAMAGVTVYHAGTAVRDGQLVTAGGRVLGVTAVADTLGEARELAYAAADKIRFEGRQVRTDIARGVPTPTA